MGFGLGFAEGGLDGVTTKSLCNGLRRFEEEAMGIAGIDKL